MNQLIWILLLVSTASAATHSVDLSWDVVPSTNGGQVLYSVKKSGQSRGTRTTIAIELFTTTYTDKNLPANDYECYVVTATDTNMLESAESNEVCVTTPKDITTKTNHPVKLIAKPK